MGKHSTVGLMLLMMAMSSLGNDAVFKSKTADGTVIFSDAPVARDGELQRLAYKDFKGRETATQSCLGATEAVLAARYQDLESSFLSAATEHRLDLALLRAIARTESCFDSQAISRAGAEGVMQLMPTTAASLGVTNAFHSDQNIRAGALYFSKMLKKFNGELPLALAAYNAGPGAVDRYDGIPPFPETKLYIKRVLDQYQKYQASNRTSSRAL
ncbi:MAG: lytic transglycosylase domain-containing protein [Gammaproteobacteria bacterium]|nr:lytic transglycosylase domain-containing protein [Gammaproteobacteria bacterium]